MKIVFDTYAWIEYFLGTKKGDIVSGYLEKSEIFTPSIVLLELSYKADREGWNFNEHLNFIKMNSEIIGINEKFVLSFGRIYNNFKKKTRDVGLADVIVLATAIFKEAKVLTGDKHFKNISEAIVL